MIRRGHVFVVASDETGFSGPADVFDLDDESFRAWVVGVFVVARAVVPVQDELAGDAVTLKVRPGVRLGG